MLIRPVSSTEIQECYETIGAEMMKWPPPPPEQVPDAREEIERSSHFHDVRIAGRVWTEEFTAAEYVAMMSISSDHRPMESAKRRHLFAQMRRARQAARGPHLQAQPDNPPRRSPETLAPL